jgi:hypothetical protein
VASARLRARPGRALLVVVGVAASIAMLVGVLGGGLAAQDRTLQRSLASLPPAQRSFRIDSFGLPVGRSYGATDRSARAALSLLTPAQPFRATSFRTLIVAGELVRLVGIDGLSRVARLRSGRWPRVCRPARCEFVQVGRRGRPVLGEGGIHLVRVGIAEVPDQGAFGGSLSTDSTVAQQEHPTLVLVDGAASFDHLAAFDGLFRTYSWIAPLDPARLHIWQVPGILAHESEVQTLLARDGDTYQLTGPDAALVAARQDGHVAAQRMVLVGGEISALLLGFALVAAVGLKRGVRNEARRLSQRGARRGQLWLAAVTEIGAMTLAGASVGVALGILVVFVIAQAGALPGGAVLAHSVASSAGLAVIAGAWIVATVAIVAAVSVPETRRAHRVRLLDVAALGAAVAVALGLSSDRGSAGTLSGSAGQRLLFVLLPGLICFVAAVAAGRLLGPVMRLGERLSRGAASALHLAFLVLARAPARTVATVGFLLVSIGLALFAASYRLTLADGARDEAAFAVPLDFTLTEGSRLLLPLNAAPLARYDRLAPGVDAYPVLRRPANVAGGGTAVLSPTVLGLPAAAVPSLHWRSDFSHLSLGSIARRLGAGGPAILQGVAIPHGTRSLGLSVRIRGVPVTLDLVVQSASKRLIVLPLGDRNAGTWRLSARLPGPGTARKVIGLQVALNPLESHQVTHREAEGENSAIPRGSASLGRLTATTASGRRRIVTGWSGWLARGGARLNPGNPPRLAYAFTQGQTFFVRRPQATDNHPLRVIVSPAIARSATGGSLTLDFQDAQLPARIVGVAARFPDADQLGDGFVIADESRLATALGAEAPGTADPDEVWLSAPAAVAGQVGGKLARRPFASLVLASRRDLQHGLGSQPLARGITLTLTSAGLIALLLAAIGLWVTVISDARDERGELFDLEAQGVPPKTLRNQLRVRSFVLVAFGAIGGLALGLVLSRLAVSIAGVSAETTDPVPPLRFEPAWSTAVLGLAGFVVVVALLTELTTRHALKGASPSKGSWSLE